MLKVRRKRHFQRSIKRNLHILKIIGAVFTGLVIIGAAAFALFKTDIFKVKTVNVVGTGSFVSAVDMQSLVEGSVVGRNIFFIDKEEVRANLLRNFRGAKSISVKIRLPDKLILEVTERDPLALIFNDQSKDYFIVDSEGFVLGVVDASKTNLPEIRYEGDIRVGDIISEDLVPVYLDLMRSLDENEVQATSVSFYPRYVRLFIQDGVEVLIGNDKNKLEALKIVKNLVRQERLEEKSLNKIDLRYDKVSVQ
ncbi:MAG: FtsQ-type POTRA domain-containing protein [Patescibacteria group bacterium]|jgi:cell division septal protein FtsQ